VELFDQPPVVRVSASLELVRHWKAYLDAPDRYLRHVL
jgi:hypothetical protein